MKDSSLPVGLFKWTVENNNTEDIDVSIMFTWQCGSASDSFELRDVKTKEFSHSNYDTQLTGVSISQQLCKMPLEYCIAAQTSVTYMFFLYSIKT